MCLWRALLLRVQLQLKLFYVDKSDDRLVQYSASLSDFTAAAQCIQPHGIHIRIHTYAWDVLRRWEKDVDTVIRTAGNTGHGAEQHNMAAVSMACSQFWSVSAEPSSACYQSVVHSCAGLPAEHPLHCHTKQTQSIWKGWFVYRWILLQRWLCRKARTLVQVLDQKILAGGDIWKGLPHQDLLLASRQG